ncbi:DRY EERY domain-containing protein [Citrus sinensis]|uniref:DRY EERY domain-containing protein n=2 Tax=Citrus sinensis TaxID=2711 RepID=A0ACB8J376_CITSI|nr:DRY EERY domain-containing protein [Citrus sinensis]
MWHEARRSERKVHDMMDAARKRAQRRAVFLAKRRGDPQQSIQVIGSRSRVYRDDGLYQATEDQQGLIPWNGKQDVLIDRFDGRALLDFIREPAKHLHAQKKSEEEEELEEFVNFERYRDLIKHRRRGCRFHPSQPSASKGTYSQVGFSYDGNGSEGQHFPDDEDEEDEDEDDDEDDYNSDDSNDEGMDIIAKEFGVKRYGWLVYMDKKAKEEEKRQKEAIKGDPAIRKLSRKERRKASQIEREREREASRVSGARVLHHDPYREPRRSPTYEAYPRFRRSRSRSRSYSPSYSRRHARGSYSEEVHRSKSRTPKVEYITEFGGSGDGDEPKLEGFSPPPSPPAQADLLNRPSSGCILEALHVDPASGVSLVKEKSTKSIKPAVSTSSALSKLTKSNVTGGPLKQQQGEKKETPQERLKRIMSKQLNKQIKKDTAAEMAKKQEQERQRQEKLAETSRLSRRRHSSSRSRSYSRSPPRRRRYSRSPSRGKSSRRNYSRSRSHSRSPPRTQSRSPRVRSRSRY